MTEATIAIHTAHVLASLATSLRRRVKLKTVQLLKTVSRDHNVLFIKVRTRPVWTASRIPYASVFLSAPPKITINIQQTSQSYTAECFQLLGGHRVASTRTWFRYPRVSERFRAPWTAPNGSKSPKTHRAPAPTVGSESELCILGIPENSAMFTLLLLLSLALPVWLSEWAQLKAAGGALCVRARAQGDRASAHLSPLIIWSNLKKGEPLWLQIYCIL